MRLNNKKIKSYIWFVYVLIGILFTLFVITKFFPIRIFNQIPIYVFPIFGFILFVVIQYRGKQWFEYDSDGEALNFKNEDVVLSHFISSSKKHSEFPKRKLHSYQITGNIFKRTLEILLRSKKSNTGYSKLKYDISYLNKTEVKNIRKSLDKVLEENKTKVFK
ncbi:MAG: hypothetical protein ACK5MD_00860 [Flavobacteriales bacterium]